MNVPAHSTAANDERQSDLSTDVFMALRNRFFDDDADPTVYSLRPKRNTQDDPLDGYLCDALSIDLRRGIETKRADGPLITPDMAIYRPELCDRFSREALRGAPDLIIGLEVKKLERQSSGRIARASGMDYNSTPPCGTVRVYDLDGIAVDIKGYYLFVCQEPTQRAGETHQLTALALCDGDVLNDDFDYYLSIIGQRSKEIGLGTYGDGANRVRPMLVFSNPLGAPLLDHHATLIHRRADLEAVCPQLRHVGVIERSVPGDSTTGTRVFQCYRDVRDAPGNAEPFRVRDPFPTPRRSARTIPRGRFFVALRPST